MAMKDIAYDLVLEDDLGEAHQIEVAGYPADEAASLDDFRYRIHNAPDLFLGAFRRISSSERGNLLGYVCATRAAEPTLTRASMSTHVPTGPSICIHSVCVVEAERRRGLGVALMHEYLSRLRKDAPSKGYERVLLITHDDLSGFYNRAGFEWMGPSTVQHGIRQWFEMKYELSVSSTRDLQSTAGISINQLPPNITQMDLLAALNRSASKPKATSRRFADFDHGTGDLIVTEGDTKLNKFNLVCPHKGCELIILLNNAVTLIEAESIQLEPRDHPPHPDLPALPPPPASTPWWHVTGGPMSFENVGFTRPVNDITAPSGARIKLLACGGCDLGPVGWCEEGGSQFWLHVQRVAYRE